MNGGTVNEIVVGEIITIYAAVIDRQGDRLLVRFKRDGKEREDWFLTDELVGLGFDD